ncbi:hypothetical protein [Caulobacter sp. UNC279MFTsu5.1]|uniref:hypothetical protein n=1 Tax=Caulobacter sp. UNC279MFTsu5.1 TaxID=1502775 RepID=UPI000366FDAF|nr:hypothetical protein [Caulobacter sp. UNC279MFTsu5.1]
MEYPNDVDLVWLAVDETDRLAAVVTGGSGPIPEQVLINDDDDVLGIERALLALPSIGAASVHAQVPNPQSFKALSERGLFVYDWTDVHRVRSAEIGAYELVASPSVTLSLADLPIGLRRLVAPVDRGALLGALTLRVS